MARSKDYVVSNGASNFERFVRICCLVRTRRSNFANVGLFEYVVLFERGVRNIGAAFNGKFATLLTVACVERDV